MSRHPWVLAGCLLLVGLALLVFGSVLGDTGGGVALGTLGLLILLLLVVLIVCLVIRSIYRLVKRWRSRSSRARVDQQIASLAGENETDSKRLASEVMETTSASQSLVQRGAALPCRGLTGTT